MQFIEPFREPVPWKALGKFLHVLMCSLVEGPTRPISKLMNASISYWNSHRLDGLSDLNSQPNGFRYGKEED